MFQRGSTPYQPQLAPHDQSAQRRCRFGTKHRRDLENALVAQLGTGTIAVHPHANQGIDEDRRVDDAHGISARSCPLA